MLMLDAILDSIRENHPAALRDWAGAALIAMWEGVPGSHSIAEALKVETQDVEQFQSLLVATERRIGARVTQRKTEDELWTVVESLEDQFGQNAIERAFTMLRNARNAAGNPLEMAWKLSIHPQLVVGVLTVLNNVSFAGGGDDGPEDGPGVAAALKPPPWSPRGPHIGLRQRDAKSLPEEEETA